MCSENFSRHLCDAFEYCDCCFESLACTDPITFHQCNESEVVGGMLFTRAMSTAKQDVELLLRRLPADISADSPIYAGIVLKKVIHQTRMLARFPRAGHKVPEYDDDDIRELLVYSYRIIYRVQGDEVIVGAVIHGKRLLQ